MQIGKTCLIIAGGEFQAKFASSYINHIYHGKRPDMMIAADRGLQGYQALDILPDLVLGDFDSVGEDVQKWVHGHSGVEVLAYPPEKNYSDTHLAIAEAIKRGAAEISILGATGSRFDHALANLYLLKTCLVNGICAELVDFNNRIRIINRGISIRRQEQHGDYVSLFPYSDEVDGVTLRGFQYPLQNICMKKSCYDDVMQDMGPSRGISNVIVDDIGEIQLKSGELLVIESRD